MYLYSVWKKDQHYSATITWQDTGEIGSILEQDGYELWSTLELSQDALRRQDQILECERHLARINSASSIALESGDQAVVF